MRSEIYEKMEYLSKLEKTDFPFISLYIDADFQHSLDRTENARIQIKNCLREKEKQLKENKEHVTSLRADINKITNYLSNELERDTKGLAIFACNEFDVFEVIKSSESFKNECRVNHMPNLTQLAHKMEDSKKTLIIMVDRRFSKIMELRSNDILFEDIHQHEKQAIIMHHEVHGYHKEGDSDAKGNYKVISGAPRTGGWSQRRFQRGVQLQIGQHYKKTTEVVVKLIEENNYDNIVIIAQEHEAKNFIKQLPAHIEEKVCSIINMQMIASHDDIINEVKKQLELAKRKIELEMVKKAINECFENKDHCALGIENAADKAKDGRIDKLIVAEDMVTKGYEFGGYYYKEEDNSQREDEFDLVSEAIRLTIKNGGEVTFIKTESEASEELNKLQNIGAILRY
ncbi:MAG: Vms1/Ankzf1 family peptidyl-tRNA hydrolase [bacterium]